MKDHYQLLVVGAGPAGSYAALTAARAGIDTLLVERDRQVGFPLACAEGTSFAGLNKFLEPRPEFIATEISKLGCRVATGYGFVREAQGTLGYILNRPQFDSFIASKAAAAGAELVTSSFVSEVVPGNGTPARINIENGHGVKVLTADYVIAADGVESLIGRKAGIDTRLNLRDCETTLQYRVSGISLDPKCLWFYVGAKYSPDGYLWVFPKSDSAANVGLGYNPSKTKPDRLRKILDSFLKESFGNYNIEFECCGMVPKFIGTKTLGRENLLLAGDAARTIDSITGAGIARALHTGKLAAEAVTAALEQNLPVVELQQIYRRNVERELGRDLKLYKRLYPVFRKFSDSDWEHLARMLADYLAKEKAGVIDPAAMLVSLFTSAPRLLRLARHIF